MSSHEEQSAVPGNAVSQRFTEKMANQNAAMEMGFWMGVGMGLLAAAALVLTYFLHH